MTRSDVALTCESGRSNGNSCIALRDSVKKLKFLEFIIIAIPLSLFKFLTTVSILGDFTACQ